MWVAIGRLWAGLRVKLWEHPRSVPPWHVGWHSGTGARAASGTGSPSRYPLHRYSHGSFNASALGAWIRPGAIKVSVCAAAGTSGEALCHDGFYISLGQTYAHGTYGHMRVNVYIYIISCACVPASLKR